MSTYAHARRRSTTTTLPTPLVAGEATQTPVSLMSATPHEPQYQCGHCRGVAAPGDVYEGSFCSARCYYQHKGEKVLVKVHSASHFCNTCYAQVRDVEPVPDRVHPEADGLQYPTPNTAVGIDDFGRDRYDRLERTRWSCTCGAVNPNTTSAELQNVDLERVIDNLYTALVWLADREAIQNAPDVTAYNDALATRPRDAAYAVGRAVFGDG